MTEPNRSRTSFGPVLLAGAGSAGCLALAASRTWLQASGAAASVTKTVEVSGSDAAPLGLALALVALAGWGVILVSGTRARRTAMAINAVATLGVLAVVVTFWSEDHGPALEALQAIGVPRIESISHQPWYWITAVLGLAQLAVLAFGYRDAPTWPTMSSRYDAPGDRAAGRPNAGAADPAATAEPLADLELWKALDEGRDPTSG